MSSIINRFRDFFFAPKSGTRVRGGIIVSSFLVSVFLWIIVTLNITYQSEVRYLLKIEDVPEYIQVPHQFNPEVRANLEGLGRDLLVEFAKFSKDTISVPFTENMENGWIVTNDFTQVFQENIPQGLKVRQISPQQILVNFENKVRKRVPLISRLDVQLQAAHFLEYAHYEPDSVDVVGPERVLDTLTQWPTEAISTPEVGKEPITWEVPLLDTLDEISIIPSRVLLRLKAKQYTQENINIPIRIVGVPPGKYVELKEPVLELVCLVPMNAYGDLLDQALILEVPFRSLDTEFPSFVPNISFLPDDVRLLRVNPSEVSFVVVNK